MTNYRCLIAYFLLCEFVVGFMHSVAAQSRAGRGNSAMSLSKYDSLQNDVEDAFERILNSISPLKLGLSRLADNMPLKALSGFDYDVVETADSVKIIADLPGYAKDMIDVTVAGNLLKISASKDSEIKEETDNYHRIGRSYGKVTRVITLPDNIVDGKSESEFKDGVLTLTFPKSDGKSSIRKIPLK